MWGGADMPKNSGRVLPMCAFANRRQTSVWTTKQARAHIAALNFLNCSQGKHEEWWVGKKSMDKRDFVKGQYFLGKIKAHRRRWKKRVNAWEKVRVTLPALPSLKATQHGAEIASSVFCHREYESSQWVFKFLNCVGCCWRNPLASRSTQSTEARPTWLWGGRKSGKRHKNIKQH